MELLKYVIISFEICQNETLPYKYALIINGARFF